jgi:hypothetical protein
VAVVLLQMNAKCRNKNSRLFTASMGAELELHSCHIADILVPVSLEAMCKFTECSKKITAHMCLSALWIPTLVEPYLTHQPVHDAAVGPCATQ